MAAIPVTCISKPSGDNRYESITHLGNGAGKWTVAQVIYWIESGTHTFYTRVGGKTAYVGVYKANGRKYVRTYADGRWNNNLLSLPRCP